MGKVWKKSNFRTKTHLENFGRIAWFSGGTKGRLVVADRVQRKDYRKLTVSGGEGGD